MNRVWCSLFGGGTPLLVCASVAALAACVVDGSGRGVVSSDSAGVVIVTSPGEDVALPWRVSLVDRVAMPDSAATPPPWMIAADASTGRAYVLDRNTSRVYAFDTTGSLAVSWGRSGRGPYEMAAPVAIDVGADGSIVVLDASRQLLIRWTAEGEPLDEATLPVSYWGPGFADMDGSIVLVRSERDASNPSELGQELVHVVGDRVHVLASQPQRMTPVELPCLRMPVPKAFAASIVWAAHDSRVYHIVWPHYRIDISEGGRTVASLRRDIAPIPVTDSMAIREIEGGQLQRLLRMCGMQADALLRAIGAEPETSPAVWLTVDPLRHVWVSRVTAGASLVDIFDDAGAYLGTLHDVPIPVAFLSPTRFLALRDPFLDPVLELWEVDGRERA